MNEQKIPPNVQRLTDYINSMDNPTQVFEALTVILPRLATRKGGELTLTLPPDR